jgi:hypothetical protein
VNYLYDFFWAIWILALLLIIAYGAVIAFGAPFLPTLKKTQADAIKLIDLKKGQLLVDLGSGDGSVLSRAAASGLRTVGYELNPFLVIYSWLVTRRHGRKVKIVMGNFWHSDLSEVDGIFVFLIGHYMEKLDKLITSQPHKKLRVVSHAFEIPGRKAIKKQGALFLYEYPASPKRQQ